MKVLLAHLPPERIEQVIANGLERMTSVTIIDPDALRRDLADIRARGYSVTFGESHPDVHGVAAPVRDHTGAVVASVSVLGASSRIAKNRISDLVTQVTSTGSDISRDLGYAHRPRDASLQAVAVQKRRGGTR
jgi:DNA-binding IclR family transcriptional regulator